MEDVLDASLVSVVAAETAPGEPGILEERG